ncbi:MAG: hypothetical protein IKB30_02430 [Clostridia bacterium]|nr:hypothetical protein [Clostridia bacterium]
MKKSFRNVLATSLAAIMTFAAFSGCAEEKTPKLPDYSATAKQYEFSAYSGPNTGVYQMDGNYLTIGPDQRNAEGYTVYKDAGFTILYLSGTASYSGEEWSTSDCKRAWDAALSVGIDKILLCDKRIDALVELKDSLVGESSSCRFKTEIELKETVKSYLEDYINYDCFYGVRVSDERDYTYINGMGKLYKAVKDAAEELGKEDIYIHLNVLPYDGVYSRFGKQGQFENMTDAYNAYIENYITATGANRISSDVYAFRGNGITGQFYSTAQVIKEMANKHGIEASFCLQSFELYSGQNHIYRAVGKSEMKMELLSLMGMGYDHFYYYTYQIAETRGTGWTENTTFLNSAGEKTNVYYYGQELMADAQKMANVILNYNYLGGKFYTAPIPNGDVSCYLSGPGETTVTNSALKFDNTHEFALIKDENVDFDNDVVFITELKDIKNELYMYMLQNVIDPANGEYGRTAENVTVKFDGGYTHVAELCDGNLTYKKLSDGKYTNTLSAGDAVYLIPLK